MRCAFAATSGLLVALLSTSMLVACSERNPRTGSSGSGRASHYVDRHYLDVEWDAAMSAGGDIQDTLLLMPRLLTAFGQNIYAYDYGDHRLKAFDNRGHLQWTFGRPGGGPGEFRNPIDLQVSADGTLWLADHANGRLTLVSSEGTLVKHIPYHGGVPVGNIIPVEGGAVGVALAAGDTFWIRLDMEGRIVGTQPMPLSELRDVDPLVRQSIAHVSGDLQWATVYYFSGLFLLHHGLEFKCSGWLVESSPFPRSESPANLPVWAAAVAVSGSSIYVLARGETERELTIVDEYAAEDCAYRRTLRLPGRSVALAASDDYLFFVSEDPTPHLAALRLSEIR